MTDKKTERVYESLALAAGEMKAIPKDQRNREQGFDFRSIETIVGHAKPLLEKYQLALIPVGFRVLETAEVSSSRGTRGWRTVVEGFWLIAHDDGSHVEASMLGEAVDYGDKSTSKAVQMAYKYLLTQLLGIGSEDPDGITPEAAVSRIDPVNAAKAQVLEMVEGDTDEAKELWAEAREAVGAADDAEAATHLEAILSYARHATGKEAK